MPHYKVKMKYQDTTIGGVLLPDYPVPDVPAGTKYKIVRELRGSGVDLNFIIETDAPLAEHIRTVAENEPVVTTRKAWDKKHPKHAKPWTTRAVAAEPV